MTLDDKISEAVALAIAEGKPTFRETVDGPEKYCAQCDEWWPADRDFFNAAADGLGRLHYCCRACRKDTTTRGQAQLPARGTASLLEVELHLQLAYRPCDVGAVRAAIAQHRHRPVRAALARVCPDHATGVHVGHLTAQLGDGFDALDQHLLQLRGGAGGLGHVINRIQRSAQV